MGTERQNVFHRRLATEGIVLLGVMLSRCVCVRRAAYIMHRPHAASISAAKVMRCIQRSLVCFYNTPHVLYWFNGA